MNEALGFGLEQTVVRNLTLRNYFAAKYFVLYSPAAEGPLGWVCRLFTGPDMTDAEIAAECYALADAMLAARTNPDSEETP